MFTVVEIQKSAPNVQTSTATDHVTRGDALQRYHYILQFASQTTLLKHGAVLLTEDGTLVMSEVHGSEVEGDGAAV